MHITIQENIRYAWCMSCAGYIYIYMHVACMFHITCMDLAIFKLIIKLLAILKLIIPDTYTCTHVDRGGVSIYPISLKSRHGEISRHCTICGDNSRVARFQGRHLQRSTCTRVHSFSTNNECTYNAHVHTCIVVKPIPYSKILGAAFIAMSWLKHVVTFRGWWGFEVQQDFEEITYFDVKRFRMNTYMTYLAYTLFQICIKHDMLPTCNMHVTCLLFTYYMHCACNYYFSHTTLILPLLQHACCLNMRYTTVTGMFR